MANMKSGFFAAIASLATLVGARGAWSGPAVMGGYQTQPGAAPFTEIVTEFQVPVAPVNYEAPFAIWPGLASKTHLMQSVLRYAGEGCGESSCPHWEMQNESRPENFRGQAVTVSPGDWILAAVWLDTSNTATCNILAGTNCNYLIEWEDLNTGQSDKGFLKTA